MRAHARHEGEILEHVLLEVARARVYRGDVRIYAAEMKNRDTKRSFMPRIGRDCQPH